MAPITTIQQYPLEKKKIAKKSIQSIIGWGILLAIVSGALFIYLEGRAGSLPLIAGAILLAVIIIEPIYQYFYYLTYFYDVRPDFIVIKKGPITPTEITLSYDKIQDVFVDQDLLDRIFGLYDVHVSTATISSGIEAHIDGVNRADATAIRGIILSHIKRKKR